MGVVHWSKNAAANANADPAVNWAEGQPANSVNNSARAMMAGVAAWRDDNSGTILATKGSGNTYALTTNQGIPNFANSFTVSFTVNAAGGAGATTLAVDALAAKAIKMDDGLDPRAGDLNINRLYKATYLVGADVFIVHGRSALSSTGGTVGELTVTGAATVGSLSVGGATTFNGPLTVNANTTAVPAIGTGMSVSWNRSAGGAELNIYNTSNVGSQGIRFSKVSGIGTYVDVGQFNVGFASVPGTFAVGSTLSAGGTISGPLGSFTAANFGDANFGAYLGGGNPVLNFNPNSYLIHDRASGNLGYVVAGESIFTVAPSGAITTKEFGTTIAARIEARAAAYSSLCLPLTGGEMTGNLTVQVAEPQVVLTYPTVMSGRWILGGDGRLNWQRFAGVWNTLFSVGFNGDVTMSQFVGVGNGSGDLSTRIEARAAAYADDRKNGCLTGIRLTGGSDVVSGNSAMAEPGAPFIVTGLGWSGTQAGTLSFRVRQVQQVYGSGAVINLPFV